MENLIGKWLDNRYELLEVIGSGGMAVVYKAKCHRLNRLVAVKILKPELAEDADFRRRFRDESQAVAMLSHPNIVSVYDVSRGEIEYIVMELIDGITLKEYMERRGQLNWREALHFITQIMKGLSHAHSRGIVHRDIKPQNIMVLRDGSVKVADFGIASLNNSAETRTQEAIGSVHYISPEQAKGDRTDARSDVYSAGVVLYEMLTNRLPFEGDSAVSVALQHLSAVPLSPREINPDVPEALEKICMKAMTADLDKRYPSADAMLADLEEFRKNPDVELDFTISDLRTKATDEPTQNLPAGTAELLHRAQEPVREPEEDDRRTQKILIIAGIVALCAVAVFLLWRVVMHSLDTEPAQTDFEVPNLLGMTVEAAMADSRVAGVFEIEQLGSREDARPAGQIIEQSPLSGSTVRANRTISVFVSAGEHTEEMPDLANQDYRTAKIRLNQLNLELDILPIVKRYSETVTENFVISTDPAPGETLKVGDSVTLVVSMGRKTNSTTVIPFYGSSIETVRQQVATLKLTMGEVTEQYSDTVPAGCVIEQSIPSNTSVDEGTVISFVVSLGPEEKEPDPPAVEPDPQQNTDETPTDPVTETPSTSGESVEQPEGEL